MPAPRVGVLALQGDFERHENIVKELGGAPVRVRRPEELEACAGLVIPGGESTTLHKLLRLCHLLEPLARFAENRALLGTCAGMILMARELEEAGGVEPLGILDITVTRNGFGRQVDSFEAELGVVGELFVQPGPSIGVFIRAPRIRRVGDGVETLAVYEQEPVAVRHGRHMALSFHPEIAGDGRWHRLWMDGLD